MPPNNTLWPLGSHTPAKHNVLRYYLDAWLPILGFSAGRILFIDGFAGPGKYEGGEDGSPVIAVKAFLEHTARGKIRAEVRFLFIEAGEQRAAYLAQLMEEYRPQLPAGCTIDVIHGKFDEELAAGLASLDEAKQRMAPAFVMVDPFGISETPMSLIGNILQNPKSEVYVSFMYEAINRHKESPEFERHLDVLFGTSRWREGINIPDSDERKEFLYKLYEKQLRDNGAKHVVHFELYEGNRLVYAIFFATKHELGCGKMKEAIWRVAPFGDFEFRGSRAGQMALGLERVDLEPLKQNLLRTFAQRDYVSIEELDKWVQGDATDFCKKHLRPALKALEIDGMLTVHPTSRKKARTYPDGTKLKFDRPAEDQTASEASGSG